MTTLRSDAKQHGDLSLSALAAVIWSVAAIVDHRNGNSGTYDLGIFTQLLWSAASGHGFHSSVLDAVFWGEHLNIVLLPVVPLYRLLPGPEVLLVLQALALASGGPAVGRIARRLGFGRRAALAWVACTLLHPTLFYIAVWDFHPIVVALPLLLWALSAVVDERWNRATILALSTLLVQEECGLVLAGLGLCWAFLYGQRRRGLIVAAVGAGWFWLAAGVVMPAYNAGQVPHLERYAYLGTTLGDMFLHVLLHPIDVLQHAATPLKLVTLVAWLAPGAGLALLGGRWLVPAVVPLAYNFLSLASNQFDFRAQYASVIVPFLLVAALHAAARLQRTGVRFPVTHVVVACTLLSQALLFLIPPISARDDVAGPVAVRPTVALSALRQLDVPMEQPVIATNALGAHLAHRPALRLFDAAAAAAPPAGTWILDLELSDPWPFETRAAYVEAVTGLLQRQDLRVATCSAALLVLEPGARSDSTAAIAEHVLRRYEPVPKGYRLARRLSGRGG